jgi:hypothetical protein
MREGTPVLDQDWPFPNHADLSPKESRSRVRIQRAKHLIHRAKHGNPLPEAPEAIDPPPQEQHDEGTVDLRTVPTAKYTHL